jgi:hypothetical protein
MVFNASSGAQFRAMPLVPEYSNPHIWADKTLIRARGGKAVP